MKIVTNIFIQTLTNYLFLKLSDLQYQGFKLVNLREELLE